MNGLMPLTLRDGTCVPVRGIRTEDAPALQRLVGRSSERSINLRFFGPLKALSDESGRHFADVDGEDRFALVALDPRDRGEIVGVVRYEREGETGAAEYAALVEDRFQGRGLGIGLTRRLIEAARENGIGRLAAMPMPPPMHSVTRPYWPPVRARWCRILTVRTAPVAPMGCPSATAPPTGLSFSSGTSSSRPTAIAMEEKASFASTASRSSTLRPAFFRAMREAGIMPVPMTDGSTPATAAETSLPATGRPSSPAFLSLETSIMEAPSLMPLALAAVTVPPSFLKTGLSFCRPSTLAFGRMCSSSVNWMVSFFCFTSTGTIWPSKCSSSCALAARWWLRTA